jgi:hypothetical protein
MTIPASKPLAAVELLERFGGLFLAGRLEEMVSMWALPCPVHRGDELTSVRTPEELVAYLRAMREAIEPEGVAALSPELVGIEIPRDQRFRVWMRWILERQGGTRVPLPAVYHLHRRPSGSLCIEGMEVPDAPADAEAPSPLGGPPTGPPAARAPDRARVRVALFDLLDRLGRLLTEGRYAELGDLHVFPCPYEAEGSYEVMLNSEMLARTVGGWTEAQRARGVRKFEARLVAQDVPRGPRMRAWVRWVHTMADGSQEFLGTDLLFLCRRPDGRLVIEMIDFQSLPDPDGPSEIEAS